jgi:hypothetical protein
VDDGIGAERDDGGHGVGEWEISCKVALELRLGTESGRCDAVLEGNGWSHWRDRFGMRTTLPEVLDQHAERKILRHGGKTTKKRHIMLSNEWVIARQHRAMPARVATAKRVGADYATGARCAYQSMAMDKFASGSSPRFVCGRRQRIASATGTAGKAAVRLAHILRRPQIIVFAAQQPRDPDRSHGWWGF